MYRIGLIGTENSHARACAKVFAQEPDFADMQVTAVYGDEGVEKSEQIREFFPSCVIVDSPEKMLGLVDAVMITSRDGKLHYGYAKPFLEAGIPMFVDKPFTVAGDEAIQLAAEAKKRGIPLCGGSSLKCCPDVVEMGQIRWDLGENMRTGFASAPLVIDSPYSGFYFYASHLVEMCLAVFGWEPESVTALRKGKCVTAVVHYPGFDAVCSYTDGCGRYFVQLTGAKDVLQAREIDLAPAYRLEAEEFVQMVRTGHMPYTYEQLMMPVFFLNAVQESYETGKTVPIRKERLE